MGIFIIREIWKILFQTSWTKTRWITN